MDPNFISQTNTSSLWLETVQKLNFPNLETNIETEVVVIGAGIVGITTALLLKEAGRKVVVIEMNNVGGSVTGHTTAKVTSQHGLIYDYLISSFGEEKARLYAESNEAGKEFISQSIEKYKIQADFYRTDSYVFAETKEDREKVQKEAEATAKLGLPSDFVEEIHIPLEFFGAIRFKNQAYFHPLKYLYPLAKRINGDGNFIFENTKAMEIKSKEGRVVTEKGEIKAKMIVVATHVPFFKTPGLFFSRLYQYQSYLMAVEIDGGIPKEMYYGTNSHTQRPANTSKGPVLIIGGEPHKVGQGRDIKQHYRNIIEFFEKYYRVKDVKYYWSTQDPNTPDKVPYIGKIADNLYMASGFAGWGMTGGTVAGMLISDLILGKKNEWEELYNPNRKTLKESAGEFTGQTANVTGQFMKRFSKEEDIDVDVLKNGEGRVGKVNGETIGVYKDENGEIFAISPFCTFEGCELVWNNAEKTWDCPCCGSRFTYDGKVLYGPATKNLEQKKI